MSYTLALEVEQKGFGDVHTTRSYQPPYPEIFDISQTSPRPHSNQEMGAAIRRILPELFVAISGLIFATFRIGFS